MESTPEAETNEKKRSSVRFGSGCVVIDPPLLVLALAVPMQQHSPVHRIVLVPVNSLETTFPNHTSPAIVRPSPL